MLYKWTMTIIVFKIIRNKKERKLIRNVGLKNDRARLNDSRFRDVIAALENGLFTYTSSTIINSYLFIFQHKPKPSPHIDLWS